MLETLSLFLGIWLLFLLLAIYYLSQSPDGGMGRFRESVSEHLSAESRAKVLLREMLASIRQRARESGLSKVPVVLTNHPKDIRDWAGLERFVGDIAEAEDLEFITLTELAEKLRSGEFHVLKSVPSA